VAAADASRREIERNLHDGAQQRLVAMAVMLGLVARTADTDPASVPPMLTELREDAQATVTELRELAHGIYPPLLRDNGLGKALQNAAGRAILPTTVTVHTDRRFDSAVEAAVYFCCLEALQNAGNHAGDDATITIEVHHTDDLLEFTVQDDGAGFDTTEADAGHGFINMRDRLGPLGGTLTVHSTPGTGTAVRARIPIEQTGTSTLARSG
jgi:signal transduction histidine kinase